MVMAVLKLVLTCNTGEAVSNTTSSEQHTVHSEAFIHAVSLDLRRPIQDSEQYHYENFHGIANNVMMAIISSIQELLHHSTDINN